MGNRGVDYAERVIRSLPTHRAAMMARHGFLGYRYRCDSEPSMGHRWWKVTRPDGAQLFTAIHHHLINVIVSVQAEIERQEKRIRNASGG